MEFNEFYYISMHFLHRYCHLALQPNSGEYPRVQACTHVHVYARVRAHAHVYASHRPQQPGNSKHAIPYISCESALLFCVVQCWSFSIIPKYSVMIFYLDGSQPLAIQRNSFNMVFSIMFTIFGDENFVDENFGILVFYCSELMISNYSLTIRDDVLSRLFWLTRIYWNHVLINYFHHIHHFLWRKSGELRKKTKINGENIEIAHVDAFFC